MFEDDSVTQVNAIEVRPAGGLPGGRSLTLRLRYGGVLVGYVETGSLYIQDHVSPEFTILREDAYAFPVLGRPSWSANATIPRESFAFQARIRVPRDQVVATGGELKAREPGDSLTTWSYQSVTAVPFLNIAIAPYRVLETPVARVYHFAEDSAGARLLGDAIAAALDRFARWYGPLGVSPRLTVMEIPQGFGSQASLEGGIIQTADAFRDRSELAQVYHELSHLWNVPDLERPSPRWNEGLAGFLQWRMAAELDGWNGWEGRFQRVRKSLLERCAAPAPCHRIPASRYGEAGLTDRSYQVGLLMFWALYQTLGAEGFDRAYRSFFQGHRETGARTSDLVNAFERESGRSAPIFADWLTTTRWYDRLAGDSTMSDLLARYPDGP
jgi:hypothetical protein